MAGMSNAAMRGEQPATAAVSNEADATMPATAASMDMSAACQQCAGAAVAHREATARMVGMGM